MKCQSCGAVIAGATGRCPRCGERASGADDAQGTIGQGRAGPEPEGLGFEPVLSTGDPGILALAESVLRGANVPHVVRGDGLQDLFGAGRLGTGFNPLAGPAVLEVSPSDRDRVRELLSELVEDESFEDGEPVEADDGSDDEARRGSNGEPSSPGALQEAADGPSPVEQAVFRTLVLVHVLVGALRTRLETGFDRLPWSLIEEVDRFLEPSPLWETFADLVPAPLVLHWVSAIGLLAFWNPARMVYAALWVWWVLSALFGPVYLDFGGDAALRLVDRLLGGAILGFSFFGPISSAFTARSRS